ncbi:T9SS type A sorting domain-containing protein [candidate division WOR-3 bacterium]|nr:T9SS type A sorting domain-containing protein [candidate division WOR-3 bacterium]
MRKFILSCLLFAFVFGSQATEKRIIEVQKEVKEIKTKISTERDISPTTEPLIGQIPVREDDFPEIIEGNPEDDPAFRWGFDKVIYTGDVAYNPWAMTLNIDDEAISVDYIGGDTVRAAIACVDSAVRVYRSNDNGVTWVYENYYYASAAAFYEPEIITGPNGYYHVFARYGGNNGGIFVRTYNRSGSVVSSAWIENSSDTVKNYSVCSDRVDNLSYKLYLAYHKGLPGAGQLGDGIFMTRSLDYGANWETHVQEGYNGSGFPDLAYGKSGEVYMSFLAHFTNNEKAIRVTRSTDYGATWPNPHTTIQQDTVIKQGPQIVAAHDGSGDVWMIWPIRNENTNQDYGLRWSWSTDAGVNWTPYTVVNSFANWNEVLPSIAIWDGYNTSYDDPYVTFIKSYYDWTNPSVNTFYWDDGSSAWSGDTTYNDSVPTFTRPIQTWVYPGGGAPAIAYVGDDGVNVYFDSWSMSGVEEEEPLSGKELFIRPNPFSRTTLIQYSLPTRSNVSIKGYNALGQEVVTLFNGVKESGSHELEWYGVDNNGVALPRGIYFLRIETALANASEKVVIIR